MIRDDRIVKKSIEIPPLRKRFWERLLEKARERTNLHAHNSPGVDRWLGAVVGKPGFSFGYVINQTSAACELFIDGGKESKNLNKSRFDVLHTHKREIEQSFGGKLEWERMDMRRGSKVTKRFEEIGLRDEDKWDYLQDKMIDTMIRLEAAVREYTR